ncbi:MAG: SMC-Scp complex subunit ScpB [Candidatus Bruticola sp.]
MSESAANFSDYPTLPEQKYAASPRFELAHLQPDQRLAILETILFLASGPLKIDDIKEVTGWPAILIEQDLLSLADSYVGRGLELCQAGGAWRLTTAAFTAPWAERFLRCENRRRLSKAQLETLAIVAYRQPVTRAEIESYRGARSDRPLSQLEDLNLIKCTGRSSVPGHPIQYGTTADFLRYFGLNSLAALPEISIEAELFKRLADHPLNLEKVEEDGASTANNLPVISEELSSQKSTAESASVADRNNQTPVKLDGPSDDLLKLFAKITKRRSRSN